MSIKQKKVSMTVNEIENFIILASAKTGRVPIPAFSF